MKKTLFGTLLFSLILSSLSYAEADNDKIVERRGAREKLIAENTSTSNISLSPEEEKEAYAALERARARIEKEEQEKAQSQRLIEKEKIIENQSSIENQSKEVSEMSTGLSPEEEKEAYAALERVRARIEKEDEERAKALKESL